MRRSDGDSAKEAPKPRIYVDRCLGNVLVPAVFRDAGYDVVTKEDQFGSRRVADEEWIRFADDENMVALTKDAAIRRRPLERHALTYSNLRVLVLTKGHLGAEAQAETFRAALPSIERLWRRHRPWVYVVTPSGVRRVHVPQP